MRAAVAACVLATLAGCSSRASSSGTTHDGGLASGIAISNLVAVEAPGNVLAYDVSWKISDAAASELEVACDGLDPWTISDAAVSTTHDVFVMGLVTGASCTLTARATVGGHDVSESATIHVGDLPDYLPAVELSVPATSAVTPGWTLVNFSDGFHAVPYTVAMIDNAGRYRWYYQYPTTESGSDTPVIQYKDGVVIGGRYLPMSYVSWQGKIIWRGPSGGHHEVRPAETPGNFYFLEETPCASLQNAGGIIYEYNSTTNSTDWGWTLCDHYTPPKDTPDWSHTNAVALFPDHKSLLLSMRNQSAVTKIDRASGDIQWVMGFRGDPSDGFNGDFAMAAQDHFYRQHDATVLPSGNILLFDNGEKGIRNYSRAIEIAYTYNPAGTSEAHVVWEYRHSPDIYADIWGSAQRLENGNTLVDFGQRTIAWHTTIVEAAPDGTTLWEIKLPVYVGVYRAERVAAPPLGFVLP